MNPSVASVPQVPRYVRYNNQPVKFASMHGKDVAEVVPVSMATHFPTDDAAYLRARRQWQTQSEMQRVTICKHRDQPPQLTLES